MNCKIITVSKKARRKIASYLSSKHNDDRSGWFKINNKDGLSFQFEAFDGKCRIFISNEERCERPKIMFIWLHDRYETFMENVISECLKASK
jgi:hypothetical protein